MSPGQGSSARRMRARQALQRAKRALQRGHRARARVWAWRAARLDPNWDLPWALLGWLSTDPRARRHYYIQALRRNPENRWVRQQLRALFAREDTSRAASRPAAPPRARPQPARRKAWAWALALTLMLSVALAARGLPSPWATARAAWVRLIATATPT
ncbi:MAG: hypothetical protein GXO54_01905, partial [Chloroflexi bacterium]|nr:hypothetical protein [Chloroflexota bacterium]